MSQFKKFFPALNSGIYADTAASGLMSQDLLNWRQQQDHDLLAHGSSVWPKKNQMLKETRASIKRFFNAAEADVALLPNFSIGLNLLLENQSPDQHVLLIENDYPSVNWPFENRDFQISYVKANGDMEAQIENKVSSEEISIFAFSLIQWLNGVKIDLEFLKGLKQRFPSLIIIADGTQYCGAFNLHFDNSGIDILGSSGYKWLLGGYGNGFLLVKKEIQSRFDLRSTGFNSAEGDLDSKHSISFCKKLEPGHLDSHNFGSLKFSLDYLSQIGMDHVENHNRELSEKALAKFAALDLLEDEVLFRKEHGTIFRICAERPIYDHLLQNEVRCSWRSNGIRLSFHFYNTEEEIDRIIDFLKMRI